MVSAQAQAQAQAIYDRFYKSSQSSRSNAQKAAEQAKALKEQYGLVVKGKYITTDRVSNDSERNKIINEYRKLVEREKRSNSVASDLLDKARTRRDKILDNARIKELRARGYSNSQAVSKVLGKSTKTNASVAAERKAKAEADRQAAIDQREKFLLSGKSKQGTKSQIEAAARSQLAKGNITQAQANKYLPKKSSSKQANFSSIDGTQQYASPPTQNFTAAPANFSSVSGRASYAPPPSRSAQVRKEAVQKRNEPFTAPFFSLEGQKQRVKNVGRVYSSIFDFNRDTRINVNVGKQGGRTQRFLTGLAPQNPADVAILALPIGAAGQAVKGGGVALRGAGAAVKSVGVRSFGSVAKATSKGTGAVSRGLKAAKASKAGRVASKVRSNKVGRFTTDVIFTSAKGAAIVQGVKKGSAVTAPKDQRDIIGSSEFKQAMKAGFGAEQEALSKGNLFKAAAFEINPFFSDQKDVYEQTIRDQFKAQGYSGKRLDSAVAAAKRQRRAAEVGEATSLLEISRSAERIGRRGVADAFAKSAGKPIDEKKIGSKIFKKVFGPIAAAGVVEGTSQEVAQSFSRERDLEAKRIAIAGGIGGLTAGTIGGVIGATRPKRPVLSKTIEVGTFITDPFEKPGDLAQDAVELASRRLFGKTTRVPVISMSPPDKVANFGVGTQTFNSKKSRGRKGGKGKGRGKPSKVMSFDVATKAPIPVGIPLPNIFGSPTNVPKPPTTVKVVGKRPTPVPTPVLPNIPDVGVPTPPQVPISPNVPVNTNIPIGIPIPTRTPQPLVPPPAPLGFGTGFGFGAGKGKKRRRVVNELQAGFDLLGKLGVVGAAPKRKKRVSRKKSKKRGKRR